MVVRLPPNLAKLSAFSVQISALSTDGKVPIRSHDGSTPDSLALRLSGRRAKSGAPHDTSPAAIDPRSPDRPMARAAARRALSSPATSPSLTWLPLPPRQGHPSPGGPAFPESAWDAIARTGRSPVEQAHETIATERRYARGEICRQGLAMDPTLTVICAVVLIWIGLGRPASSRDDRSRP
jgi:hypothetical protein